MKFSVLAGGVGGAKLANGLSKWLSPDDMAVIVNTGDDFEFLGFYICPDIDTVMYNLAGIIILTLGMA
ncbi:MAG TPA: 2-phospho-L-lactate transferase CofD family protein [Anaerolineaceae bacterium]|nr:2-phospho-L-lactate transferase CofD family protein [Anaerolineaceae bacterium]